MKNQKLLKLFVFSTLFILSQRSIAQCPTTDLTLSTQIEIDNFATDYPNCSILSEGLNISGIDITNLNGLSGLNRINSYLAVGNTSITSYTGLHNITHIDEVYIGNNNNVTSNSGFEGLISAKLIFFTAGPTITDLTIFSNLRTVTRKLSAGGPAVTSLAGLESLTTVGSGLLTDRLSVGGPVLESLEGLNNLTRVNGRFVVSNAPMLENLEGIDKLNRIDDEFRIADNPLLTSLNGANAITFAGELTIEDNAILPNLQGLSNLNTDEITIANNPGLNNLIGLGTLSPSRILIENNSLTSLDGLQGLSSVEYFDILNNPNLASLTGLNNLSTVDFFVIKDNGSLLNLTGLTGLTRVVEDFTIQNNNGLLNLSGLDNLESVGNGLDGILPTFIIGGNDALENLTGLGNFIFVDGEFYISGNPSLTNMTGLENFSFARRFGIGSNAALTSVDGLSSFGVVEDDLTISNNPLLTSLAGLSAYDHVPTEQVTIYNNSLLSFCSVDGFCNLVENYTEKLFAFNNAVGCATEAEIEETCTLALPVEGMQLSASLDADNHVLLKWETQSEINNSHFTILHSLDGRNWTDGQIIAGAGNSEVLVQYQTIDKDAHQGINYYKVKQTNFDGEYSFSNIVSIDVVSQNHIVYPNPANGKINIQMQDGTKLNNFKLVNLIGQTVHEMTFTSNNALSQKEVSVAHLAPGYYYLTINNQQTPTPLIIQ